MSQSTRKVYNLFDPYTFRFPGRAGGISPFQQFYFPDEGGGAGEGEGGVGDGGGDGGDPDAQLRAAAHEFKDTNGYVRVPGVKDPVKLADLVQAHSLRGQSESSLKVMGEIAKMLRAGGGRKTQEVKAGGGAGDGKGKAVDPFAELEATEILDGKTVANLLRNVESGRLSPIEQALVAMAKKVQTLEAGHVHRSMREGEEDLGRHVSDALGSLKLPKMGDKDIEGMDVLKEIVRDLYFSYEDKDQPRLLANGELAKQVQGRFKALKTFFSNYNKAELEAARQRGRQQLFAKPGSNTSPGKGGKKGPMSPRQAADILFAAQ